MNKKKTVSQLVQEVLEQLQQQGYTAYTVKVYKRCYSGLEAYVIENEIEEYSEEVALNYLEAGFGLKLNGFYETATRKIRDAMHRLMILWHYQQYGTVDFIVKKRKKSFLCPEEFKDEYSSFRSHCDRKKYSVLGLITLLNHVHKFLLFLAHNGISKIKDIQGFQLSQFVSMLMGYSQRHVASIVSSVNGFLRLMFEEGYLTSEVWELMPKMKSSRNAFLPPSWKKEDVLRLLTAIDRGNPSGKRDYALLVLVVRLGLRASDIRNLKLNNLDWNKKKIEFLQKKTRQTLELPLLDDVGWALIDYLKNGRPRTRTEIIFVNHKAPYGPFKETNGMMHILRKYMSFAGLEIPENEHCGLHSLRSTLARTMLESGTPLPVISDVLGHESLQSTSIYLKIDLQGLRKCAIDPEEVFSYVS
jgi:integrase/recombinase XerD